MEYKAIDWERPLFREDSMGSGASVTVGGTPQSNTIAPFLGSTLEKSRKQVWDTESFIRYPNIFGKSQGVNDNTISPKVDYRLLGNTFVRNMLRCEYDLPHVPIPNIKEQKFGHLRDKNFDSQEVDATSLAEKKGLEANVKQKTFKVAVDKLARLKMLTK